MHLLWVLGKGTQQFTHAWANEGHVPDIIHKNAADNGMHELFESKVYTAAKTTNNKGGGIAKGGGSPSTAAGHFV